MITDKQADKLNKFKLELINCAEELSDKYDMSIPEIAIVFKWLGDNAPFAFEFAKWTPVTRCIQRSVSC